MIGIDIVSVARLGRALDRSPALRRRAFAEDELATAATRGAHAADFLAGRFAAKEATLKALGAGIGDGVALADVVVRTAPDGAPALELRGTAAQAAHGRGLAAGHVSISHDAGVAVAVVVLTPGA